MKKILIAVALLAVLVSPSFADIFNINLSGGYTSLTMQNVNNDNQTKVNNINATPDLSAKCDKLGPGYYAALDLNFAVLPVLMFGPRVEYIGSFPAKFTETGNLSLNIPGYGTESGSGSITDNFGVSLLPIELGFSYKLGFPLVPISFKAGVYGGYALAFAYTSTTESIGPYASPAINVPYTGGAFVGEALASVDLSVAPFVTLGLNIGYRTCTVPQFKVPNDVTVDGVTVATKNMTIKDVNGNDLAYDFSGLVAGIALNFGF